MKKQHTMNLSPKSNRSIRRYLLSSIFAIVLVGWSISSALNFIDAQEQVAEVFDAELAQMSRVLQSLVIANRQLTPPSEQLSTYSQALPYFDQEILAQQFDEEEFNESGHEYERKIAFEVWTDNGQLILANHLALPQDFGSLRSGYDSSDTGLISWRSFTLTDQTNGILVRVAQRTDVRDELTQEIALHSIVPGLLMTPLILLICGFAIRRGLHPLADISQQLKNRNYDTLTPLSSAQTPKELQQLITELNQLFNRVSESYQRERRFTADAAHELRTPLSIAKIHLQNVQQISSDETVQKYAAKALVGMERLIHLVNQLLTLSKLESTENLRDDLVNLKVLVDDILDELSELPVNSHTHINCDSNEQILLHGSETEMRILLRNLLDNAFRYAEKDSDLSIKLSNQRLTIFNQCPRDMLSMPNGSKSTEDLFERFKRGTQTYSEGSGLGLAICRQICDRYGYSVSLTVIEDETIHGIETSVSFHQKTPLES